MAECSGPIEFVDEELTIPFLRKDPCLLLCFDYPFSKLAGVQVRMKTDWVQWAEQRLTHVREVTDETLFIEFF